MKFRNYLDTIADIGIYPLISLLIFFVFFVGLIVYVWKLDKKTVRKMSNIPLEDGTFRKAVLTIALALTGFAGLAQDAAPAASRGNQELLMYLIIAGLVFIIALVIVIFVQVIYLLRRLSEKQDAQKASTMVFSDSWWKKFRGIGTDISDEEKILIKGHDYDGIQELDNRMPPWLAFLFQGTIAFAIIYLVIYRVTDWGPSPETELAVELKEAEVAKAAFLQKAGAALDENSVKALLDEKTLAAGQTIFVEKCAACHGAAGEGGVGPNLTDENWLHGGGIHNIFKTIKYGIPEKGMISWEKQLKPQEIQQVSSFILKIKGTNPPNAKEPQGEPWNESSADSTGAVAMKEL